MRNRMTLAILFSFATVSAAHAEEACRSAKEMVRMSKAFYAADPKRTNIINPQASLKFSVENDARMPTQLLLREGSEELYLDIDANGILQDIDKIVSLSKDADVCRVRNGVIEQLVEGESASVTVGFMFPYRRTDGQFSIEELNEGAKDGSKVMNGVAPSGLGFAVPSLKTLIISRGKDSSISPTAKFTRSGKPVSVPITVYDTLQYIRLKDIKSSKADAMFIEGEYVLSATFKMDLEKIGEAEAKRLAQSKPAVN